MQNAVVLGGDQDIRENVDGELALVIQEDGDADVVVSADGDAELTVHGWAETEIVQVFDGEVGVITKVATGDPYTGEYEVDPIFEEQILATKDKRMVEDVTVKAIRVSTTTNPQGGNTIYIGGVYG